MAKQVVIENPILNSPFHEPARHFKFSQEGITSEIVESRRVSAYFVPVPRSKKKSKAGTLFDTECFLVVTPRIWRPDKCHVSHVVADTDSWEQKMAQALEDMGEVMRYVKNHNVGFTIPYTINSEEKNFYPDFIVRFDDGHGTDDLLNLIIEVTGEKKKDKAAKVQTARTLWVPAVNNHGGFGRWDFVEIVDPWDAKNAIHATIGTKVRRTCQA